MKKNKGFTLIEMVLYIGLFSILMGGLVMVAFQLSQNSNQLTSRDVAQEEMNFVLKKFDWVLTGASDIDINSGILKIDKDSDFFKFKLEDNTIKFCKNPCNDFFPLTTQNVRVNNFTFTEINTDPKGVSIDLDINGMINTYTKYLRI